MKFINVHDSVVTTIGSAICSTSRTPAGRDHHDSLTSLPFDMRFA